MTQATTATTNEEKMMEDCYPSRVDDMPRMIPRVDPVIYSAKNEATGPLDAQQLNEYERNGYLVLPEFFKPGEVAQWTEELRRLGTDEGVKQRDEAIVEPSSNDLRSLFSVHTLSDVFSRVALDERIVSRIRQILGSDAYIHQSRVNLKPGFVGKEFYWHSDFETWHVEDGMPRMRAVSCSILLTNNYSYNGPLMLVPGSHKYFISCVGKTPEQNFKQSLKRQDLGVPDHQTLTHLTEQAGIDMPLGNAGTVLLFDCNTMHGSSGNISPYPRSNLFFVYNSVENRLASPYCGLKPRPSYIATRDVEVA